MSEKAASGGSNGGKWPVFPCEDPTHPALDLYFRHFDDELQSHEAVHLIIGTTPPSLIGLSAAISTAALVPVPEPVTAEEKAADTVKARIERVKFNTHCEQTLRTEQARQARYDAGVAEIKSNLATIISNTMRDTAPARLRALKKACQLDAEGKVHDGVAMYKILVALKTEDGPTASRSSKWHESQFNEMNATQLPDHCSAEQYIKKVNTLLQVHLPNFTKISLNGASLSEVVIEWMPECLASDGRTLMRQLKERQAAIDALKSKIAVMADGAAKTATEAAMLTMPYGMDDYEAVLRECTRIVSSSADQTIENARMAAAAMPTGTTLEVTTRDAAIAAAAAMVPGAPPPAAPRPTASAAAPTAASAAAAAAAEAEAKKQRKERQAQELLAAAARRAEKENSGRLSKLLPQGEWCRFGTCRFAHAPDEQCWANPDWSGPLPPEVQKNENHVKRIEKRRIATAERLFSEGKRASKTPKVLRTAAVKPGAMATPPGLRPTQPLHNPVFDPDPMGDGLGLGGRLSFEGEPGFVADTLGATSATDVDDAAPAAIALTHEQLASQGLDDEAIACEEHEGDWYALIDHAHDEGEPRIFNVQGAAELGALLSMSTDEARAGELELVSFGTDAAGYDAMLAWQKQRAEDQQAHVRAEIAKVAKPAPKPIEGGGGQHGSPALEAAAVRGVADPAGQAEMELALALEQTAVTQRAAEAHRNLLDSGCSADEGQAELLLAARAAEARRNLLDSVVDGASGHGGLVWSRDHLGAARQLRSELAADAADARATQRPETSPPRPALYPEVPSSQFYVVFGGPFEGVHEVFNVDSELRPLLATAEARAFGPADGVVSRERAEAKLRALEQARKAEQWRSAPAPNNDDDENVPMGGRITLTFPQARAAVATLTPKSPLNEIRRVFKAAELPVALHVGGGSPSHVSPGAGRNKLDLLVEARRSFNMAIPSEWDVDVTVEQQSVVAEAPPGATVRANAVSPVTLIPARAPLVTDRQMTCCLLVVCIALLAAIVPLALGVPFHSVVVMVLTYMSGARGMTEGYHLTQAVNGTMVVMQPGELDPLSVFFGTSIMFTVMALMLHVLFECGFHDTMREFMARVVDHVAGGQRALRRVPRIVRHVAAGLGLSVTFTVLFLLARGVDGHVTEGKVARTRSVVMGTPMPAQMRQIVLERAVQEHNIAMMPNHLSPVDAVSLAGSLGIPAFNLGRQIDDGLEATAAELARATVPRLNMLDSGAAIDTSDGVLEKNGGYAVEGTRGPNFIAVSTANGTVVPPEHVTNRIPVRRRNQTVGVLERRESLIMSNCPHNLISVGSLAANDGYGFWIAPYAQESYLRPSHDPGEDIPFLNLGVAILPDAETSAKSCMPTVARGTRGASKLDAEAVHRTFNGRSTEALRHLPEVAPDAPPAWGKLEKRACDPCERAKAKRVPLTGSAGDRFDASKTVSCDDWSVSVGHMHGGQQVVGGYHHNGSGLNRFYLKHTKNGPETAKCTRLFFAWARTYCQWAITHFHADNAPNLIAGENAEVCAELGVHITSCAPYEPRGNSTIERPWRTWAEDIRSALTHANLTNCESLWWYAGRDANQKDWCIPIRVPHGKEIDGRKWTTKWELFTGHRPRVSQHYPFGCCAYMLTYHPKTKVAQRGVRCLNFGRAEGQPGYLLFDGQRLHVSPHCVMMPWAFPGLRRKTGGGLMVPEPEVDATQRDVTTKPTQEPQSASAPPAAPADSDDDDDAGSGDGGAARAREAAPQRTDDDESGMPPTVDDESDDDSGDDGNGGEAPRISQRLNTANVH